MVLYETLIEVSQTVMTGSSRSVIGLKGAVVAVRRRATEASGRESVRRVGKFHAGFAKSSALVLGRKRVS